MNISTLHESLPYLIKAKITPNLIGHHGIGKSQSIKQFADANDLEFIDLRLSQMEAGDLLGLAEFERDKDGKAVATKFMRPSWFPTDPNSKGILFLDEINRARRDVLQAVFQLVLDRKIHEYCLPEKWAVVCAQNPNSENYIVTDISDAAFIDRFCLIKLAPSKQEFFGYCRRKKFDEQLLQFLSDQPALLQGELEAFDLSEVKPSRRSWEMVNRLIELKTPVHILRELSQGLVGTTASTALMKALSESDKPINAYDILDSYEKFAKKIKEYSNAKTGGRLDMLKFTCDSILEYAQNNKKVLNKGQSENLGKFLNEIPKDLSYSLCRELYMEESTRSTIDENIDLLSEIAEKRGIKVEGLKKKKE